MSTMNTIHQLSSSCFVFSINCFCLFVCCCWLSERVGSTVYMYEDPYALHVCKPCPECGVYVLCFMQKGMTKGLCKVTGERKKDVLGRTATTTWKCKYEEVCWSLSRSNLARSSLHGCLLCHSSSHCRRSQSCSYYHYELHCSPPRTQHGIVWQCGHGYISVSHEWDGHGWSVS